MANKLVTIAVCSSSPSTLINTEHKGDTAKIVAHGVTHTGGKDGNFISIPDCSDSRYFPEHHIQVKANDGSWTVSIWNNDHQNHRLHWSDSARYEEGKTLGLEGKATIAIFVDASNPSRPVVYANLA